MVKLASLIPDQEDILDYMGLSAELVRAEIDRSERFDELKGITAEQKQESDRRAWANWFKRYAERVRQDAVDRDSAEYRTKRLEMLNANNPR